MRHDNVAVSCPHDKRWSHQKYRCEQPFKVFFISVIKQSVLNSVAVASRSHLKTGEKPQKILKETASPPTACNFSAFSLSYIYFSVFNSVFSIISKKTFGCARENKKPKQKKEITWSNVRSIIQSLPVEEFFSCFFFCLCRRILLIQAHLNHPQNIRSLQDSPLSSHRSSSSPRRS